MARRLRILGKTAVCFALVVCLLFASIVLPMGKPVPNAAANPVALPLVEALKYLIGLLLVTELGMEFSSQAELDNAVNFAVSQDEIKKFCETQWNPGDTHVLDYLWQGLSDPGLQMSQEGMAQYNSNSAVGKFFNWCLGGFVGTSVSVAEKAVDLYSLLGSKHDALVSLLRSVFFGGASIAQGQTFMPFPVAACTWSEYTIWGFPMFPVTIDGYKAIGYESKLTEIEKYSIPIPMAFPPILGLYGCEKGRKLYVVYVPIADRYDVNWDVLDGTAGAFQQLGKGQQVKNSYFGYRIRKGYLTGENAKVDYMDMYVGVLVEDKSGAIVDSKYMPYMTMELPGIKPYVKNPYYQAPDLSIDGDIASNPEYGNAKDLAGNAQKAITLPDSPADLVGTKPKDLYQGGVVIGPPALIDLVMEELGYHIGAISDALPGMQEQDYRETLEKMREYMEWINQQLREGGYTPEQLERLREILQKFQEAGETYIALGEFLDGLHGIAVEMDFAEAGEDDDIAVEYPGDDPTVPPGEGFEWRGRGDPSSGRGNWYNPLTGERWHPDLDHGEPIGPHWDYQPHENGPRYRVFPDGKVTPA